MTCTTHHHACDCREARFEAMFKEQEARVERLEEALLAMLVATSSGHYAHWDPRGKAGATCKACLARSAAADMAHAVLAGKPKEPKP